MNGDLGNFSGYNLLVAAMILSLPCSNFMSCLTVVKSHTNPWFLMVKLWNEFSWHCKTVLHVMEEKNFDGQCVTYQRFTKFFMLSFLFKKIFLIIV